MGMLSARAKITPLVNEHPLFPFRIADTTGLGIPVN
jgi:hypothetical protein